MENTEVNNEAVEIKDPKAVLDALDRAKNDAKKFREEKEQLEMEFNNQMTLLGKYSGQLLKEKTIQNIQKMGISNPDRLLKYIQMDKLEFDENFDVKGLEDQVSAIKSDFPELFDPKLLVAGKADSADAVIVNAQLSVSDRQARMLLGK